MRNIFTGNTEMYKRHKSHFDMIEDWILLIKLNIDDIKISIHTKETKGSRPIVESQKDFLKNDIDRFFNESNNFLFTDNSQMVKINGRQRRPKTLKNGTIQHPCPYNFKYKFKLVLVNNGTQYLFHITDYEKQIRRTIALNELGI
jgi:hypothetical protein